MEPETKRPKNNPIAVYDFTFPQCDKEDFTEKLNEIFKTWAFQLEEGDTGFMHFQGRGSLIKKRRPSEIIQVLKRLDFALHVSPTSENSLKEDKGAGKYCLKFDTRRDGPWTSDDEEVYIPRQFRDINLYDWQQDIIDDAQHFNSRTVNLIYDPHGCSGKTTIACLCSLHHNGLRVPPINDYEKLLATVCDILRGKGQRKPGPVFIDLPRFMDKSKLHGIFSAIEEIKNGHSYDLRYKYREWWYDSPPVWVCTNMPPPVEALSRDRWRFWTISQGELVEYVPPVPVD